MRTTVVMLAVVGWALLLQGCPVTTTTTTTTSTSTTTTMLPADSLPPSMPQGLTAQATACGTVSLAWRPATDTGGSGLTAYDVVRDSAVAARVAAPATTLIDAGLAPGVHAYQVRAVDGAGNVSMASLPAAVTVVGCGRPPVASAGPDVFTQTLTAVAFDGRGSSDPEGAIASFTWTFGDGGQATGSTASHAYATAGTYTVTLTVRDADGLTASDTLVVTVANRAPVANAGADRALAPGATASFDGGSSSDPDGRVVSYAWTFGDGTTGSGVTASHAWAASGTYTVTLTVRDDLGAQGSDSATITVGGTWSHAIGGTGDDRALAVDVDGSGNAAVTGYFSGTIDLGGGPMTSEHLPWLDPTQYKDVFVARYDADGRHLWSRRIGAEADDRGNAVATAADGDVIVAGSVGCRVDFGDGVLTADAGMVDGFVARYAAADGALVWARRWGSMGNESGWGVAVDGAGDVLVAGIFQGTVDLGGGPLTAAGGSTDQDVFVAKYTAAGAHLWSKRFGNASAFDYVTGLAVDPAGNVLLAGNFWGTIGFGGATLAGAGGYDVYLAKLSSAGAHVWSHAYGGSTDDSAQAVAVTASGDVVAAGSFTGAIDFGGGALGSEGGQDVFVAALSSAGAHRWSRRAGGSGDDAARSVTLNGAGDVLVTGPFTGSVDFGGGTLTAVGGGDMFVARYAGVTGATLSSRRFGGTGSQYGQSIAAQPGGGAIVAGYFQNTVDFGSGTLTSAGTWDGAVASLQP